MSQEKKDSASPINENAFQGTVVEKGPEFKAMLSILHQINAKFNEQDQNLITLDRNYDELAKIVNQIIDFLDGIKELFDKVRFA